MNQVQAISVPTPLPQAITVPRLLAWFLPSNLRANVAHARSVPSVQVSENVSHLYLAWFLPSKKRANEPHPPSIVSAYQSPREN